MPGDGANAITSLFVNQGLWIRQRGGDCPEPYKRRGRCKMEPERAVIGRKKGCLTWRHPFPVQIVFVAPSTSHPPPVHNECVPVHVVARGGGEKHCRTGEVIGGTPTTGGDPFHDLAVSGLIRP